jgi:hypothetical protein
MELNFEQLKDYQEEIYQEALKEIYQDLPETFINFSNNNLLNHCLHNTKVGTKSEQSARVLNNWINLGIIIIQDEDKGKNRRFDRLESIWLSIVVEARKFGIPLESLKQTRKYLTNSPIENFSILKFSIIDSIIRAPKVLMIFDDGSIKITSLSSYANRVSRGIYPTHILFKLLDFISIEYPNNAFAVDFKIPNTYESIEKMTLLFFLKTGEYKSIKVSINSDDVRLIENSQALAKNKELMKYITNWNFSKIEITLQDDVNVIIAP